jgi:hypothetical protein
MKVGIVKWRKRVDTRKAVLMLVAMVMAET